jgi:hypothetical protein
VKAMKRLSWWEPRRCTLREAMALLLKSFGLKAWLRVIVVVCVIAFAGTLILRRLIPTLDLDWLDVLRAVAIATAVVFLFVAFAGFTACLPRRITLGLRQIRTEASHGLDVIPFKLIRRVRIEKHDGSVPTLVIEKDKGTATIGLSTKLDAELLMRMLSERLRAEWVVLHGVPFLTPEHRESAADRAP